MTLLHRICGAAVIIAMAGMFLSCHERTSHLITPIPLAPAPPEFPAVTANQLIPGIIAQVNADSLAKTVRELTGEVAVNVAGGPDTILSRCYVHPKREVARAYLLERLSRYQATVTVQAYSPTGLNIIAVQPGSHRPGRKIIICAHYDDWPSSGDAPGADDNASGVAGVLEAARVLSAHPMACTVIYALWDEEERGLMGSGYYAGQALTNGDSIWAVINLDMIGYNGDGNHAVSISGANTYRFEPEENTLDPSFQLRDYMAGIDSLYGLSLDVMKPDFVASDHEAFGNRGFSAVLLIEGAKGTPDFNPHYHSSSDRIQYFDMSFFHDCVTLAVAGAASLAGVQEGSLSRLAPVIAAKEKGSVIGENALQRNRH